MCGIAGFYPGLELSTGIPVLKRMLTRIRHRGPDESGIFINRKIALGSVRLSILDLVSGHMPMSNGDRSMWITYNGEVFNYLELKESLVRRGHSFKTGTDTEVILHLYQEYGPDFLAMLNGQFAIAIWDDDKNELFVARDRVGVRPLFYTMHQGRFIFASEVKSLLEFSGVRAEISPRAMSQILTFWTAKSPETVFRNIYEVPPGYYFKVNSDGIQKKRYWELPLVREPGSETRTLDEVSEEFHDLFSDAVRIRLRADVPVGAYLSGGIDSSVTTAFIKDISPDNLRTFSIGFNDAEYDETGYQNLVKDYLGTRHTHLKCSASEIAGIFPEVIWHAESPLLRTGPAPMFLLSELVRKENFKVVITGEGADEFLGGYDIFKEALIREFWARDQASKLRPSLLRRLYPYLPQMTNANLATLKLFFGYKLDQVSSPVYSHLLRWNNTSRIKNYLSGDVMSQLSSYDPVSEILTETEEKFRGTDLLSKAQSLEIDLFMSGYLLSSQGDRMAMGNSVEGRYPFLDYRVMEFCMKLPAKYKIRGLNEKVLLKHLMSGKLPDQIIRRPKQPYRAPILNSFFSPDAPEYIHQMLSPAQVLEAGIFNPATVAGLHARMRSGKGISEIDNMAVTAILSTQLMDQLFIRKPNPLREADLLDCTIITTEDHSLINNLC